VNFGSGVISCHLRPNICIAFKIIILYNNLIISRIQQVEPYHCIFPYCKITIASQTLFYHTISTPSTVKVWAPVHFFIAKSPLYPLFYHTLSTTYRKVRSPVQVQAMERNAPRTSEQCNLNEKIISHGSQKPDMDVSGKGKLLTFSANKTHDSTILLTEASLTGSFHQHNLRLTTARVSCKHSKQPFLNI